MYTINAGHCHVHFHSIEVARFLFTRWRCVWARWTRGVRATSLAPFFLRGRAGGRTYKRIIVRVDNSCACLMFC